MKLATAMGIGLALLLGIWAAACNPNSALDFGPTGETNTPPQDQLSRDILRDFEGRDFTLTNDDRQAHVRLSDWAPERHVIIPFWLGINPLYPGFLRPTVGHIYVMSESVAVRPLSNNEYLIRAGSKLFKSDALFEGTHTRYTEMGKMLPTVVRFVGTRVITVPRDAPASGTVTEKVPVLREVSLPMHLNEPVPGYAKFEVAKSAG